MRTKGIIGIALLSLVIGGIVGYGVLPPEVITETKIITETKYVTEPLKPFNTVYELQAWLNKNDISERQYITDTYDCDNFAVDLVRDASNDGYEMFTISGMDYYNDITKYGYYPVRKSNDGTEVVYWEDINTSLHMWNYAIIDGVVWYIEPQTDEVFCFGSFD